MENQIQDEDIASTRVTNVFNLLLQDDSGFQEFIDLNENNIHDELEHINSIDFNNNFHSNNINTNNNKENLITSSASDLDLIETANNKNIRSSSIIRKVITKIPTSSLRVSIFGMCSLALGAGTFYSKGI